MEERHIENKTKEVRSEKDIRQKIENELLEEFSTLHERILKSIKDDSSRDEDLRHLITTQMSLAAQIVREERALNGESSYLF